MIRIGNASGFYGDRFAAVREMLTGGPLDVLTGDYLAELTMLILGRDLMKDPATGYAKTFLTQLRECLRLALDRGVRIVANAGGVNTPGLVTAIGELAAEQGLDPAVGYVRGADFTARAGEDDVDRVGVLRALRNFVAAADVSVDWKGIDEAPNEALVNALCMMSPFGPREKQALLEAPDLKTRAEILIAITEIELARDDDEGSEPTLQ